MEKKYSMGSREYQREYKSLLFWLKVKNILF